MTVLRVTRCCISDRRLTDLCSEDNPLWLLNPQLDPENNACIYLAGGSDDTLPQLRWLTVSKRYGDRWTEPDPDAWPPEVCAALARYRLKGEIA